MGKQDKSHLAAQASEAAIKVNMEKGGRDGSRGVWHDKGTSINYQCPDIHWGCKAMMEMMMMALGLVWVMVMVLHGLGLWRRFYY